MVHLLIERDPKLSGNQGTRGRLFDATNPQLIPVFRWYTVERPRTGEHPCIPDGVYQCWRTKTQHHGITFEVIDAPNRTGILFHVANNMADLLGCIGLGRLLADVVSVAHPESGVLPGVINSKRAIDEFMEFLSDVEEFELKIITKN